MRKTTLIHDSETVTVIAVLRHDALEVAKAKEGPGDDDDDEDEEETATPQDEITRHVTLAELNQVIGERVSF